MPRLSKKEKQKWAFFMNAETGRRALSEYCGFGGGGCVGWKIWRLREQAKQMAEEVVLCDIVRQYH